MNYDSQYKFFGPHIGVLYGKYELLDRLRAYKVRPAPGKMMHTMITRWDTWYGEENLRKDERILAAPPSQCAENAALAFLSQGKRRILDLACGVGRDTRCLERRGIQVVGVDASLNGLRVAQERMRSGGGACSEWVAADARQLPFVDGSFEGVYCFGLLHEFTDPHWEESVAKVMGEIRRLLYDGGLLVLAVLSGDPEEGLPAVRKFTRQMFETAVQGFRPIEIKMYDDIGCTGRPDYRIWCGILEKQVDHISLRTS